MPGKREAEGEKKARSDCHFVAKPGKEKKTDQGLPNVQQPEGRYRQKGQGFAQLAKVMGHGVNPVIAAEGDEEKEKSPVEGPLFRLCFFFEGKKGGDEGDKPKPAQRDDQRAGHDHDDTANNQQNRSHWVVLFQQFVLASLPGSRAREKVGFWAPPKLSRPPGV